MDPKHAKSTSKFLSWVLRHHPEALGLTPDEAGWVNIAELLAGSAAQGRSISRDVLDYVVANNPKRRFEVSADGTRIRATQGHSINVALGYTNAEPPAVLFHGTIEGALAGIAQTGLTKMARHHVHLSPDRVTALGVGARRGKPIVLRVAAQDMWRDGHEFFLTPNGVWLTEEVPAKYITNLAPEREE